MQRQHGLRDVICFKPGNFLQVETPQKRKQVVNLLEGPRDATGKIIWEPLPLQTNDTYVAGNFSVLCPDDTGEMRILNLSQLKAKKNQIEKSRCLRHICDNYFEGKDGYYFQNETTKEEIRFTNFTLKINSQICLMTLQTKPKIVMDITILKNGNNIGNLSSEISEYLLLESQIDKKFPKCHVLTDIMPTAHAKFKRLLSLLLEENFPQKVLYIHWGWGELSAGGVREFYHGGRSDCRTEKSLPPTPDENKRALLLKDAWRIFEVGPRETIYPLFIYGAAAYMDALFTDAGHPLAHCMMAIAKSGSLKTSLFKTIYAPFVPEAQRLHTVRSTLASMDVLIQRFLDDTLIIDDFNTEGSWKEMKRKMENLQALIRSYSDKTTRAKCDGNGGISQAMIRGGCVFTGEEAMSGELPSSILRYIKINFNEKINGEKLKFYQDNPDVIATFFAEFIRYLEKNYKEICQRIKNNFESARLRYANLQFLRLKDAMIHMVLTANTLANFMLESQCLSTEEAMHWQDDFESVTLEVLLNQEKNTTPLSPHMQYLEAIWELLGTGKFKIAADINEYRRAVNDFIGYKDEDLYLMKKAELYKAVCEHFSSQRGYFSMSVDEVSRRLKSENLTKSDANSCLKKISRTINGVRPLMLALIVPKCEELLKAEGK